MYTFQGLEFTRVLPRGNGILAFAKYPNWWSEYTFFLRTDGTVKGKTSAGVWLELTRESAEFIKARIKHILKSEAGRVYA